MPALSGRVALVTGVSRRAGIGMAIARRLLTDGATVFCQGWWPHDADQPWGADTGGPAAIRTELEALGPVAVEEADFGRRGVAERLVARAVRRFGAVDILVANHARSSEQRLEELTEDELDATWRVNARGSLMLTKAFAHQHDDARPGGRVVLFTSGQHRGPMAAEIPYAVSKGAIHQMTLTLADVLADRGITVNTVNPGPTDTGWATAEVTASAARALPGGRWNQPADAAGVVAWLASDDAATVTGQVIDAEGGFRRWRV